MLRIISGERKGHIIKTVAGNRTRPTTDKVKESLFNILQSKLPGAYVLDLFSGTGNLGLESLSRGAEHAVFVEKNQAALPVLHENCHVLGYDEYIDILPYDVKRATTFLSEKNHDFDLVFMDPPYEKGLVAPTLQGLVKHPLLSLSALVVVEHTFKEEVPTAIANLPCIREEAYGDTIVTFLRSCSEH